MTDSTSRSKAHEDTTTQLAKLQDLIVGPVRQQLRGVEAQLQDPDLNVRTVSRVLPKALTIGAARDNKLASALGPILEKSIRASIIKDRQILVDTLFPIMGPAIRKAIASTIQGMIDNFNQVIDQSLSLKALRWRFEAFRTRRSFAEIVLLNTLVYQVEQVFLIQRDSGLLVAHVIAKTAASQDPDLVSAMLTAIQDFVHDSFGADREDTVDNFQVGDRKIWIEHSPSVMLAIVIRGNPPAGLKEMMRDGLDEIHLKYSDVLSKMDGDFDAMEACRPILNGLLQVQFKKRRHRISLGQLTALAVVLGAMGWAVFVHVADSHRLSGFVDRLRHQPGIVVTEVKTQDGQHHIYGMKDPFAPEPSQLLATAGISGTTVAFHWEPYQSAYPAYALRRIESLFNPPSTITMTLQQGTLRVAGAAVHQWIADARRLALLAPWIEHYDDQAVVDIDVKLNAPPSVTFVLEGRKLYAFGSAPRAWMARTRATISDLLDIDTYDDTQLLDADDQAWHALSQTIDTSVFYFEEGQSVLKKGQEAHVHAFMDAARRMAALSKLLDRPLHIDIFGHADQTGDETFNIAVSEERAKVFAELLIGSGIGSSAISTHALGSKEPVHPSVDEAGRARNRRVVFKLSQRPPKKPIQMPHP